MELRNDPFFEDAAPPVMPGFPHMGFGQRQMQRQQQPSSALSPFGGGGMLMPFGGHMHSPFSMMNGMMMNMDSMMRNMQRTGGQGQCFSSSSTTVMQYSSDGQGGTPRVYHATSSTRQGPGGVKETRKAVKDSHTGVQKMAVGHHIGDRSHVIERHVNARTGERAENQDFVNLDETDAGSFNTEWKEKTRPLNHGLVHPSLEQSRRNHFSNHRGLPSSSQHPVDEDVRSHHTDPDVQISGTSRVERGRGEGGRAGKRKHRVASSSEEEDVIVHDGRQPVPTSRSPKLSRTKSPPYVASWASSTPQSHSPSDHTHHSDNPSTSTRHTVDSTHTEPKRKGKKTTTFAL